MDSNANATTGITATYGALKRFTFSAAAPEASPFALLTLGGLIGSVVVMRRRVARR